MTQLQENPYLLQWFHFKLALMQALRCPLQKIPRLYQPISSQHKLMEHNYEFVMPKELTAQHDDFVC